MAQRERTRTATPPTATTQMTPDMTIAGSKRLRLPTVTPPSGEDYTVCQRNLRRRTMRRPCAPASLPTAKLLALALTFTSKYPAKTKYLYQRPLSSPTQPLTIMITTNLCILQRMVMCPSNASRISTTSRGHASSWVVAGRRTFDDNRFPSR